MADEIVPAQARDAGHDQEIVRGKQTRKVVTAPTFAAYYTNDTQVYTSPWDVRLRLGQVMEVDPATKTTIVQVTADVRMSPQHAKRILAILTEHLQRYEAAYGPIPQAPKD